MAEQWAFNPLVQGSTPWRPTRENTILIMVLVDRLVDRMSVVRATVMSWVRSRPDT